MESRSHPSAHPVAGQLRYRPQRCCRGRTVVSGQHWSSQHSDVPGTKEGGMPRDSRRVPPCRPRCGPVYYTLQCAHLIGPQAWHRGAMPLLGTPHMSLDTHAQSFTRGAQNGPPCTPSHTAEGTAADVQHTRATHPCSHVATRATAAAPRESSPGPSATRAQSTSPGDILAGRLGSELSRLHRMVEGGLHPPLPCWSPTPVLPRARARACASICALPRTPPGGHAP